MCTVHGWIFNDPCSHREETLSITDPVIHLIALVKGKLQMMQWHTEKQMFSVSVWAERQEIKPESGANAGTELICEEGSADTKRPLSLTAS